MTKGLSLGVKVLPLHVTIIFLLIIMHKQMMVLRCSEKQHFYVKQKVSIKKTRKIDLLNSTTCILNCR